VGVGFASPTPRPSWAPEKFWDAGEGAVRVEDLAKSYAKLESERGNLKTRLRDEFRAELESERLAARPQRPEDYALAVPEARSDIVLFDREPPPGTPVEQGKRYAVIKQDDPLWQFWRKTAHASGLSQDQFMEGVLLFAEQMIPATPRPEDAAAAKQAIYDTLGEHGAARAHSVWQGLVALVGERRARALDEALGSADAIAALEAVLERASQGRFAAFNAGAASPLKSEAELKALMADPRYWRERDPRLVAEIEDGWKRLYPPASSTYAGARVRR
jgi:hypothetical protein